ncbi:MAG: hypothetical protein V5B38_11845 [Candidatus Accumulibacter propinquus]|jgi:hypothetical protein
MRVLYGQTELPWQESIAFATRVEINKLKGLNMQAAGIERLRASKQQNTEREHAEGVNLGKNWASEDAEYDQLQRVATLRGDYRTDGKMYCSMFAKAIDGMDEDYQPRWDEIQETMEQVLDTKIPSDDMVRGFVEGAGEVFDLI